MIKRVLAVLVTSVQRVSEMMVTALARIDIDKSKNPLSNYVKLGILLRNCNQN